MSSYILECSGEIASLQQQIHCLQQELATKRAHVDSLSTQMSSLVRHQKGLKQLNLDLGDQLRTFKSTLSRARAEIVPEPINF